MVQTDIQSNNEEINSFTAEVYLGSIRLNYTILQAAGVELTLFGLCKQGSKCAQM